MIEIEEIVETSLVHLSETNLGTFPREPRKQAGGQVRFSD